MVNMLALRAVDRGFEPRSGQTKDYKINICFAYPLIRGKSKDWLTRNQNNVYEWGDISICVLLCFSELTL